MGLLADGAAWLADTLNEHESETILYRRGLDEVEIDATPGQSSFEATLDNGTVIEIEMPDWLIKPSHLVLDDVVVTPEPGDKILKTVGDTVTTYEVLSPSTTDQPYEIEQGGTIMRIHTKLTESSYESAD